MTFLSLLLEDFIASYEGIEGGVVGLFGLRGECLFEWRVDAIRTKFGLNLIFLRNVLNLLLLLLPKASDSVMVTTIGKQSFVLLVLHLVLLDFALVDKVVLPLVIVDGGRLEVNLLIVLRPWFNGFILLAYFYWSILLSFGLPVGRVLLGCRDEFVHDFVSE